MDVLKELGVTAIAIGALAWLTKSLLTHFLSKDIEKHKASLSAQHAVEMERLRNDLARQAIEHEIRYRRVDEKVAEHLAEIYRRLFHLYESVHSYVRIVEWSSEPSKEEKHKAVSEANKAFWDYFLLNRVYVPPSLYQRIHQLANKLVDITSNFTHGLQREEKGLLSDKDEGYWSKAFNAVEKEASPLFSSLVQTVQKRLGVQDEDVPNLEPDNSEGDASAK